MNTRTHASRQADEERRSALVRTVALISVGLNLAAGTVLLWQKSNSSVPTPSPSINHTSTTTSYSNGQSGNNQEGPPGALSPSPWSLVQSLDLRTYVQNLRNLGFPEAIVQNVIITELDRLFNERWANRPLDTNLWLSGPQRDAFVAQQNQSKIALESERRAQIKDFLGVEWHQIEVASREDDSLLYISLLCGALPAEKEKKLQSIWLKYKEPQLLDQLDTPARHEKRQKVYDEILAELRNILTPQEIEEMDLRYMSVEVNDVWGTENLFGVVLEPHEFRELLRIKRTEYGLFAKQLAGLKDEPQPSLEVIAEQDKQIRTLLGGERYDGYVRAKDGYFRQIHRSLRDLKLPIETSWAVYDVYKNARTHGTQLAQNAAIPESEKHQYSQNLRAEAEQELERILGSANKQRYLKHDSDWLDKLSSGKPLSE